jgi:hypothetical protein
VSPIEVVTTRWPDPYYGPPPGRGPNFASRRATSGVSAGTDMALAVIGKLYGKETAQQIAEWTEYEWQQDSTRDPFVRFLNKGDVGEMSSRMGRA